MRCEQLCRMNRSMLPRINMARFMQPTRLPSRDDGGKGRRAPGYVHSDKAAQETR